MNPKKILCICNGGNVRSAALARHIRDLNGIFADFKSDSSAIKYEAVAIGKSYMTPESMKYFKKWADLIIDLSDDGEYSIGKDIWCNPTHPELIKKIEELWKSVEEVL